MLPRSAHWYSSGEWIGFRLVSPVAQPDAAEQAKYWDELDAMTKEFFEKKEDWQCREVFPRDAGNGVSK